MILLAGGCANSNMVLHDHPLVGRVLDLRSGQALDQHQVMAAVLAADVTLLGETHDNPSHHRLQLGILKAIADDRRPVLAMEQFDTDHQAALEQAQGSPGVTAEGLADAGKLSRKGWGWPLYRPLVEEAVNRGLEVAAINLSRDGAREVAREGFVALPEGAARTVVEGVWNDSRETRLAQLIKVGHCNQISPEVLEMIVRAQRARDAVMAAAIDSHAKRPVLAILGRGHARADIAVPIYLEQLDPALRVLSVGFVEVDAGLLRAEDYEEVRDRAFDLVWFTPRFVRPDPCEALSAAGMKRAMSK